MTGRRGQLCGYTEEPVSRLVEPGSPVGASRSRRRMGRTEDAHGRAQSCDDDRRRRRARGRLAGVGVARAERQAVRRPGHRAARAVVDRRARVLAEPGRPQPRARTQQHDRDGRARPREPAVPGHPQGAQPARRRPTAIACSSPTRPSGSTTRSRPRSRRGSGATRSCSARRACPSSELRRLVAARRSGGRRQPAAARRRRADRRRRLRARHPRPGRSPARARPPAHRLRERPRVERLERRTVARRGRRAPPPTPTCASTWWRAAPASTTATPWPMP